MTSDMVKSPAAQALDYALGKKMVSLSMLAPEEFDEFLSTALREIDLRELRNFKSLKDLLSRTPGSFIYGQRQDPLEYVGVGTQAIQEDFPKGRPFDLSTHVVSVSRGVISQTVMYRRFESEEETTDPHVAASWKPDVYVRRVDERILVLRRPNDHTRADDNLFEVQYGYDKVLHQDRMEVDQIRVAHVPLDRFRERFGLYSARVAKNLIWDLALLAQKTLDDLQRRVNRFRPPAAELQRLSDSIDE